LIVSGSDRAIDFEVADHPLDPISLAIEPLVVADRDLAIGLRRDDGFDAALLQVIADRIGVVGLVGEESLRRALGQIDQRVVGRAVRRLTRSEMEGDGPAFGIPGTMNFAGEPAPRAVKSSLMNPPFPPAAETWARTVVLSML
jgi:hypothetical protein